MVNHQQGPRPPTYAGYGFLVLVVLVLCGLGAANQLWGHWLDLGAWAKDHAPSAAAPSRAAEPPPRAATTGPIPDLPKGSRPCELAGRRHQGVKEGGAQEACRRGKAYAYSRLEAMGWDRKEQWPCLDNLWMGESNWDPWSVNPSSDAYGVAQILPSAQGHPAGTELGNWKGQIDWGLRYIAGRKDYGTPCAAWRLWQARSPHWY